MASVIDSVIGGAIMAERIADMLFDIANSNRSMRFAIYKPHWNVRKNAWACRFTIGRPLKISQTIYGENGIQALVLALKTGSAHLYGSDLYKTKKLGLYGVFGNSLGIPAPNVFLDVAPYPF